MTYDEIFAQYYTLYRAEATTPDSSDDEYIIGMRLANEALNRWANYDGMYWPQLFALSGGSTGGVVTTTSGTRAYLTPTDFKEAGGWININSAGTRQSLIPIIAPEEAQFRVPDSSYAYFTTIAGGRQQLNLSLDPGTTGSSIDYVYYKKPTQYTTGSSVSEIPNPDFIVHRMLANRFRASRNPYYTSALRDAEDALKNMKIDADSGTWANPWQVADRSGTQWGGDSPSGWVW